MDAVMGYSRYTVSFLPDGIDRDRGPEMSKDRSGPVSVFHIVEEKEDQGQSLTKITLVLEILR